MAGKDNTTRIEGLEQQAYALSARLEVHEYRLGVIMDTLKRGDETARDHTTRIVYVEKEIHILTDVKGCMSAVVSIKEELVGIKRDLETLQGWKSEVKQEKAEAKRRLWAFGPNISAALVSGIIGLIFIAINYWLNSSR